MKSADTPSLRDRQRATTRNLILDAAMEVFLQSDGSLSHESVAEVASMSARTVYRHFPTQADLLQGMWARHRDRTGTRFPASEAELLPLVREQFQHFEEHAALIEAVLRLPASAEILRHGWQEGHAAFEKALENIIAELPPDRARWLVAVCQSIYSAPFWQMLRTRGQLSGVEAADAAAWAMEAVLQAARPTIKSHEPLTTDEVRDE